MRLAAASPKNFSPRLQDMRSVNYRLGPHHHALHSRVTGAEKSLAMTKGLSGLRSLPQKATYQLPSCLSGEE
jgi:hypothetical protein